MTSCQGSTQAETIPSPAELSLLSIWQSPAKAHAQSSVIIEVQGSHELMPDNCGTSAV